MTFLLKIISQNSKYTGSFDSIFKRVLLSPSMPQPKFWSRVRCWDPVGCSEELQEELALRNSSTPESRGAAGIQRGQNLLILFCLFGPQPLHSFQIHCQETHCWMGAGYLSRVKKYQSLYLFVNIQLGMYLLSLFTMMIVFL